MSNLLPQETKTTLWRTYRARFVIAGSLVMLIAGAVSFAALSPSYLVLQIDEGGQAAQLSANATAAQADRAAITHTQALLSTLAPFVSATTTATQVITEALSEKPAGIGILHINATPGNPGVIILSGTADTPKTIAAYQKTLEADARFSDVSVPVGDLAGTANGQFSITFSANF